MGPIWSDGLPLFSILCSLFVGLIVRGSSSTKFHSFNRRFLSLSLSLSLFTPVIAASLLDPTALVRSIVSSFILCFFVNTTLCLVSQKMEGKKNQNWKLRY